MLPEGTLVLLGSVHGKKASCVLCGWDAAFVSSEAANKKFREHLHLEHRRVLVTEEKGKDRAGQEWFKFLGPRYAEKEWNRP